MWFNIIKADGPTQDDIERLKAIRYKSEEDKRKIREYEKEKLIEQLRGLMERANFTPELINVTIGTLPEDYFEQIKTLETKIEDLQRQAKKDLATEKEWDEVDEDQEKIIMPIPKPNVDIRG